MFRAISSLFLFGMLSPVSTPLPDAPLSQVPQVSSLPSPRRFAVSEAFSASGAIVIDIESGNSLFSLAADERRAVGSLAKLMTAIVIIEEHDLSEVVVVPQSVVLVEGHVAGLRPGERYTVRDLLNALLIASSNDAAHTLAIYHSGSTGLFAEDMNERALSLGLYETHFDNPIGFDSAEQYSTPRELGWLALYALKNDLISSITSKKTETVRDRVSGRTITLLSTNHLLFSHPTTFYGLKTGTTDRAGQCLISLAYAQGRPVLFVVLHSAHRYRDTLQLFDFLTQSNA
jgi:serine-type D-Ala-D-Ala carboxypeptidase (penicillin-binding protein 5/6)